jgi:hypothetical protein
MPFVDTIKITDNYDTHRLIISESLRWREYRDRFGLAFYIAKQCD